MLNQNDKKSTRSCQVSTKQVAWESIHKLMALVLWFFAQECAGGVGFFAGSDGGFIEAIYISTLGLKMLRWHSMWLTCDQVFCKLDIENCYMVVHYLGLFSGIRLAFVWSRS